MTSSDRNAQQGAGARRPPEERPFNPAIFRSNDVRGVADVDLGGAVVEALGYVVASGTTTPAPPPSTVVVGRDCRLHSPRLSRALIRGACDAGAQVVDIGVVPTPVMYFAAMERARSARAAASDSGAERVVGVMVTGSHNPPEENGFKIVVGGHALGGSEIEAVRDLTRRVLTDGRGARGHATVRRDDRAAARYLSALVAGFPASGAGRARTGLKVVVDGGNGAAGALAVQAFQALGHEVVPLWCEPDGRFPNHHPDPSVEENTQDLRAQVVDKGADAGLALDGDGDRLGVVDARGSVVAPDRLGALLARRILEDRPGGLVLGEVKCSDVLFQQVRALGGRARMGPVGHSRVKAAMRAEGAVFAVELSGHMYFADRWHGFDDAIYAGARVLELIAERGEPLDAMARALPQTWATPEVRVECADDLKGRVVAHVRAEVERAGSEAETQDGVRFRQGAAWGLVRASSTQPALVLRAEGTDVQARDAMMGLLQDLVDRARAATDDARHGAGDLGAARQDACAGESRRP